MLGCSIIHPRLALPLLYFRHGKLSPWLTLLVRKKKLSIERWHLTSSHGPPFCSLALSLHRATDLGTSPLSPFHYSLICPYGLTFTSSCWGAAFELSPLCSVFSDLQKVSYQTLPVLLRRVPSALSDLRETISLKISNWLTCYWFPTPSNKPLKEFWTQLH